ncbi:hypothetical protein HYDPIDRAFT_32580, partial [Hydnomerulius pinastri MD-312]
NQWVRARVSELIPVPNDFELFENKEIYVKENTFFFDQETRKRKRTVSIDTLQNPRASPAESTFAVPPLPKLGLLKSTYGMPKNAARSRDTPPSTTSLRRPLFRRRGPLASPPTPKDIPNNEESPTKRRRKFSPEGATPPHSDLRFLSPPFERPSTGSWRKFWDRSRIARSVSPPGGDQRYASLTSTWVEGESFLPRHEWSSRVATSRPPHPQPATVALLEPGEPAAPDFIRDRDRSLKPLGYDRSPPRSPPPKPTHLATKDTPADGERPTITRSPPTHFPETPSSAGSSQYTAFSSTAPPTPPVSFPVLVRCVLPSESGTSLHYHLHAFEDSDPFGSAPNLAPHPATKLGAGLGDLPSSVDDDEFVLVTPPLVQSRLPSPAAPSWHPYSGSSAGGGKSVVRKVRGLFGKSHN